MRLYSGFLLAALPLAGGCTAVTSSYHLVDAELTVIRARNYGADEHAVYEYTMANRYLDKAREENGYAEFRMSSELAQTASEWADQAVISMDERGIAGNTAEETGNDMNGIKSQRRDERGPGYSVPAPGGK